MEQGAAAYLCVPIPIIGLEKGGDDLLIDKGEKKNPQQVRQ